MGQGGARSRSKEGEGEEEECHCDFFLSSTRVFFSEGETLSFFLPSLALSNAATLPRSRLLFLSCRSAPCARGKIVVVSCFSSSKASRLTRESAKRAREREKDREHRFFVRRRRTAKNPNVAHQAPGHGKDGQAELFRPRREAPRASPLCGQQRMKKKIGREEEGRGEKVSSWHGCLLSLSLTSFSLLNLTQTNPPGRHDRGRGPGPSLLVPRAAG